MTNTVLNAKAPTKQAAAEKIDELYVRVLKDLIKSNVMDTSMRILVACGGPADRDTLLHVGFTNFIISNLDADGAGYLGEGLWSYQDAEALSFKDDSFDFCIVHEGLHHCLSPHRALAELFRVAKYGALIFEPVDNAFTSLGVKLGFGQDYEHAAVFGHNYTSGGVRNTCIPNYIYRFTAHEMRKTILCFEPKYKLEFKFHHYLQVPWQQLRSRKSGWKKMAVVIARPFLMTIQAIIPKLFSNQIVAVILKPRQSDGLHAWLVRQGDQIVPNTAWFDTRYGKKHS